MTALPVRSLTLVIPVHQQQDHIAAVIRRLYDAVRPLVNDFEMIAVVNGSSDMSAEVCRSMQPECPGLVVIEERASGWGRAVRVGLAASTGDLVCYTNAARTNETDLRNAVALGLLNEGCAVKAVRGTRDSIVRRAGSVIYNFEARLLFHLASWDINGTPKVFPRAFSALFELEENGDLIDLEWLVTCDRRGYALIELPTTSTRRHGGRSTTGWSSAWKMYIGAIGLRRRLQQRSPQEHDHE